MGIKIGDVQRQERRGTSASAISADPTLKEGEIGYETDTGNIKVGDGSTAWTSLSYINNMVQTFDISSANQTMTLPVVSGYPQSYDFFWTGGDGTYTATLAVTNSETVGGITAATWTGEGEGNISCVSDGTNWVVKGYTDTLEIADSGNNTGRVIVKSSDGYAKVYGRLTIASLAITSASVGLFRSAQQTIDIGYTLNSTDYEASIASIGAGAPIAILEISSYTTTQMGTRFYRGDSATTGVIGKWDLDGRWRT